MALNAVSVPVPPNSNMDRGMFVWVGTAGSSGDPLGTDAKSQALLNWCAAKGVNVLYLDIWGYLGGANWSSAHMQTVQKFVHYAHASGIRVLALVGNPDWGHNQQWVANNILRSILQYEALADASSTTNIDGKLDGIIYDVEYWTVAGYTSDEPIGLCDLMNATRRILDLPVGCFAPQWLADSTSAALSVGYKGVTKLEGLCLMDNADFVAVACYNNLAVTQIGMFQNWFNYASTTALGRNFGLLCGSETGTGLGTQSYWTGNPGALAAMETAHTAISSAFTASPNTNMCFRGQCIDPYSQYSQMT